MISTFQRNRHFRKVSVNKTFTHEPESKKVMSPRRSAYTPFSVKSPLTQRENYGIDKIIDINKFIELYRTTAWVKRFCVNWKNIVNNRKETTLLKSFLRSSELRQAENDWIKINQKAFEGNNKLKDLKRELNVIVNNENFSRCEGRRQYAPLPYDSKTPILLNNKHKLALLIVKNIHECYKNIGLKHTLTDSRQRFSIVRGRNFVRGDFVTTEIDNFGPVYVKNVFGQSTYKAWVTLYMCAASRAIILDLTPGMDPSVLKRSIKRFINLRGFPSNIVSGNGKNFISQETGKSITSIGIK